MRRQRQVKSRVLVAIGVFFFALGVAMLLVSFAMDCKGAIELDVLALMTFGVGCLAFWLRKKADLGIATGN